MDKENYEDILNYLTAFEKKKITEFPKILDEFLFRVAKTGDIVFPWVKVKPVIKFKLQKVIKDFYEDFPLDEVVSRKKLDSFHYDLMKQKILDHFDTFNGAPFTIQRLCELITEPRKHYRRTDKFLRGIEKNILVVSTTDSLRRRSGDENQNQLNTKIDDWLTRKLDVPQQNGFSDSETPLQVSHILTPMSAKSENLQSANSPVNSLQANSQMKIEQHEPTNTESHAEEINTATNFSTSSYDNASEDAILEGIFGNENERNPIPSEDYECKVDNAETEIKSSETKTCKEEDESIQQNKAFGDEKGINDQVVISSLTPFT